MDKSSNQVSSFFNKWREVNKMKEEFLKDVIQRQENAQQSNRKLKSQLSKKQKEIAEQQEIISEQKKVISEQQEKSLYQEKEISLLKEELKNIASNQDEIILKVEKQIIEGLRQRSDQELEAFLDIKKEYQQKKQFRESFEPVISSVQIIEKNILDGQNEQRQAKQEQTVMNLVKEMQKKSPPEINKRSSLKSNRSSKGRSQSVKMIKSVFK